MTIGTTPASDQRAPHGAVAAFAVIALLVASCAEPPTDEELGRKFCAPIRESEDYYVGSPGYQNCLAAGMWRPGATPPGWDRVMTHAKERAQYYAQACEGLRDGVVIDVHFSTPSTSSRVSWCSGGRPLTVEFYDDSPCFLEAELFKQKPRSC
jgi:hypothetical protein